MHDLEFQLHQLAVRMEKGTISPKKAAEMLFRLATISHHYIEDPTAYRSVAEMTGKVTDA